MFHLSLTDGICWGFFAAPPLASWLEDLAGILGLPESGTDAADCRISFVPWNGIAGPMEAGRLGKILWRQGRALRITSPPERPDDILVELNPEFLGYPEIRIVDMVLTLRVIFRKAVLRGGGPIHAALAVLDGKGILIAADSGIGKSTCSRRLPLPWESLSDDTALIVRAKNGGFRAHPMPTWSAPLAGEGARPVDAPHGVPVRAVFLLQQSETDRVAPFEKKAAVRRIFGAFCQIGERCWSPEEEAAGAAAKKRLFATACAIVAEIPCYRLEATRTGRFWKRIEDVL